MLDKVLRDVVVLFVLCKVSLVPLLLLDLTLSKDSIQSHGLFTEYLTCPWY